jgi:hypothetical protein
MKNKGGRQTMACAQRPFFSQQVKQTLMRAQIAA